MIVAGYFLVEGLSQFSGTNTTRNILIIGGILFQITESLCFVAAAALAFHSRLWRISLFLLGCVLFLFSVAVMTLAQKTALQGGINEAQAIDEQRQHLREQLLSLDRMIESYQFNAEKQSKSIYKDSRALGQDSINRATEIERQKLELSDQLFRLNQQRKETSVDFFNRLQDVTGLPARETEFYFLVLRSLLIELCGILLMAFGASLRALNTRTVRLAAATRTQSAAAAAQQGKEDTLAGVAQASKAAIGGIDGRKKSRAARNRKSSARPAGNDAKEPQQPSAAKKDKQPELLQYSLLPEAADVDAHDQDEYDLDNVDLDAEIQLIEDHPKRQELTEHNYSQHIQRLRESGAQQPEKSPHEKKRRTSIIELYQKGVIAKLNREEIINGLRRYHKIDNEDSQAKPADDGYAPHDAKQQDEVSPEGETAKT